MHEDAVVDLVRQSPSLTADDVNLMTEPNERRCNGCRVGADAVPNDRRVLLGEEYDFHVGVPIFVDASHDTRRYHVEVRRRERGPPTW
jgi:hypothetical protein